MMSVGTALRRRSMRSSRPCLAARSRREMCGREPTRWRWPMLHELSGSKHRCAVNRTDAPFGPAASVLLVTAFLIARLSWATPKERRKGDARGAHALEVQPLLPGVPHGRRRRVVAAPLALLRGHGHAEQRRGGAPGLSFSYSNIWVLLSSSSNFLLLGL